jgi:hypothetical protein
MLQQGRWLHLASGTDPPPHAPRTLWCSRLPRTPGDGYISIQEFLQKCTSKDYLPGAVGARCRVVPVGLGDQSTHVDSHTPLPPVPALAVTLL